MSPKRRRRLARDQPPPQLAKMAPSTLPPLLAGLRRAVQRAAIPPGYDTTNKKVRPRWPSVAVNCPLPDRLASSTGEDPAERQGPPLLSIATAAEFTTTATRTKGAAFIISLASGPYFMLALAVPAPPCLSRHPTTPRAKISLRAYLVQVRGASLQIPSPPLSQSSWVDAVYPRVPGKQGDEKARSNRCFYPLNLLCVRPLRSSSLQLRFTRLIRRGPLFLFKPSGP